MYLCDYCHLLINNYHGRPRHGRLRQVNHVGEAPVTYEKRKKGWRINCDVGEATEGFENEQ